MKTINLEVDLGTRSNEDATLLLAKMDQVKINLDVDHEEMQSRQS